jgi:heat shock protein HspQ
MINRFSQMSMKKQYAKFSIGQIVRHVKHGYRGVIADVDPVFLGSDDWYDTMVHLSRPAKDQPWYHVLVDEDDVQAYVSEEHLQSDWSVKPIEHPFMDLFFSGFDSGHYISRQSPN